MTESLLVSDLGRDVVLEVAPHEADLFASVAAAWARGELDKPSRSPGGTVGIGLTSPVLSEVVLPLLTAALAQVAATTAERRIFRRRRGGCVEPTVPLAVIAQAETVRAACLEAGLAAGLPPRKAQVIADAVHGNLVRRLRDHLP